MLDLDDIAAKKRLADQERRAKAQARKDSKRAQRELENDRRRELAEADRAAASAMGRVNSLEKRAQRLLNEKVSGPDAIAKIARILAKPGIRTASGLGNQKAQKQTSRPQGQNGAVSFHFSVTSISKQGQLASVLKGRKSATTAMSVGQPHQRYIERDDAAERVPSAEMQNYIEDGEKAERQPDQMQADFEVSSFGTIGSDADDRAAFWVAVEEAEEKPKPTKVILDPDAHPEIWAEVRAIAARDRSIPPLLLSALATTKPVAATVSTEDGLRLVQIFQKAGFTKFAEGEAKDDAAPQPISFILGRGGRVQTRLVVELPHEMSPAQRLALAKEFCAPYGDKALPYWAVIHAPNAHNDSRNFHLHVNLYDRPAARIQNPETGNSVWDFEYVEHFVTARWQKRSRRPFQQKKLREMNSLDWVKKERERFSALANSHLQAAGIAKRLDPRRYEEMGVHEKARERIAPASYARERKGLETAQGVSLAHEQWKANFDSVVAIARADASYEAYRRAWLTQALQPQAGRQTGDAMLARRAGHEIAQASARKAELVNERNAYSHVAAKLESRARLKPKKQRDDADEAAIIVAAELKQTVSDIDDRIRLLIQRIQNAEIRLKRAKRLDDAAIHASQLEALTRSMRSMSQRLMEEPAIRLPNAPVKKPPASTGQPAPPTVSMPASAAPPPAPANKRSADLLAKVRANAKAIAAERAAAAAQESTTTPPAERPSPARQVPAPISSAVEPRPLSAEPQPGTPVAANPARPKRKSDEERQREADRIAELQKRLAIARQRQRQRGRDGPGR